MQRVWLIRAGEDAEEIDPMRRAGLIGLRYEEVGDATTLTAAEIEQALVDANRPGSAQLRARIQSFANEIKPGDLVVTPNAKRREVWISVVTGPYRFDRDSTIDGYSHTRTVDWLGWLDRNARAMSDQLKVIDQPVILVELYNREWWWKHLDSGELSSEPWTVWSKPPSSRPRASGAPKPKPTPRPKPVAMVLCAGSCGLQWSPNVLVGGICPDCRGD